LSFAAKGSLLAAMKNLIQDGTTARLATLDRLRETIIPNFLDPVPSRDALKELLEAARVPRFKANPMARRGGGFLYYSVAHVERLLRSRTLPSGVLRRKVEVAE